MPNGQAKENGVRVPHEGGQESIRELAHLRSSESL